MASETLAPRRRAWESCGPSCLAVRFLPVAMIALHCLSFHCRGVTASEYPMMSKLFLASVVLGAFLLGGLVVVVWMGQPNSSTSAPEPENRKELSEERPSPPPTPPGKVVERKEVKA